MKLKRLLLIVLLPQAYAAPISLCDSSKGLDLINRAYYSQSQIQMILTGCDKVSPTDLKVLLLHGLFARRKALQNKNYSSAIQWFEKAKQAAPDNLSISQELAITYELANQLPEAFAIYQSILDQDKTNRAALLGSARIYRIQKKFNQATAIYQNLLTNAPHDVDALNGLGLIKAAENELGVASQFFQQSLNVRPGNQEALLGLNAINKTNTQIQKAQELCNVETGFQLLNKTPIPIANIQAILKTCDNNHIDNTKTQLRHGLLARKQALVSNNFTDAITWLQKGMNSSTSQDTGPAIELAVTYEWAKQLSKAKAIYDYILAFKPSNKSALLGKARVLRLEHS
jgi:tetratricopeptide (TPR) repeat protein